MNLSLSKFPVDTGGLRRGGLMALGVIGLGIVGLAALRTDWVRSPNPSLQDESTATLVSEIRTVTALGRLEPRGEMIQLTASTSVQESRLAELRVQEGDTVAAGDIVAVLDNRDLLRASLQQAEERVRVAEAQLAQVQAGAKTGEIQAQRAEIARLQADRITNLEAQEATVARLGAELKNAQLEYDRYESLYQQGAVSASERDARQLTYDTAQRRLEEARANLARVQTTSQEEIQRATATLDQIAEVRPVDVQVAAAEVQSAQSAVAEAQVSLEQAYVRSPQAGQILKIHTRAGETVGNDGIVTLGETQQMMVVAEVYQSDVARVQLGQSVIVTSPAIPGDLQGTVDRIGLQVEQQQVVNEDPAANIDAKVVEVHVRLDESSSDQVAGLTNLQVTATIQL